MIQWNATKLEVELIRKIAKRAINLSPEIGPLADLIMDIEAAHCSGCPLYLERLLAASTLDFVHDVFGIRNHINRETGDLGGEFLPRFAMPIGVST